MEHFTIGFTVVLIIAYLINDNLTKPTYTGRELITSHPIAYEPNKVDKLLQEHGPEAEREQAYMKTSRWRYMRLQVYINQYERCIGCDTPMPMDKLELHHITYERLYNENIDTDLAMLCKSCHKRIHDAYGYSRLRKYPIVKELT